MTKPHRLDPIIDIAESKENDAARELARITSSRNIVRKQIQQLKSYRGEYKQSAVVGKNHTQATFADTQLFLGRLNSSIRAVEQQLEQIEERHAKLTIEWEKSRAKTRSLEKVVEKHNKADFHHRSKIEQKELDEVAGRSRHGYEGYQSDN